MSIANKLSFKTLKAFLLPFRDAYVRSGATVGETEYGILYVAVQMAALDGQLTDDEVQLMEDFANTCPGATSEGWMKGRDFALRHAGYLELIARLKEYTEEMRLKAFLEAVDAGPCGTFEVISRECLSYAFTFWTAMAMSDGEFSPIERAAIELLKSKLDHSRAVRKQAEIDNIKRVAAYSTHYDKVIEQLAGKRETPLQGEDFVARAEELLQEFTRNR